MDPIELLRANPFDDELRLVAADQLQRTGDPQGELAIVQHRLSTAPTEELRAREAALIARVAGADVGALDPGARDQILGVTWHLGWIKRMRVQATGWPEREAQVSAQLDAVLSTRAAALIEELELAIGSWKREVIFEELLATLIARGPYPALRVLDVGGFIEFRTGSPAYVERDLSAVYITNRHLSHSEAVIGAMSRLCPNLVEVRLQGSVAQIGDLVLPRARVFEVCTSALGKEALDGLARATWPALERLVLWFGDGEYGYGDPCDPDQVVRFVRDLETKCPKLSSLALANSPWTDEILEDLAASPPAALLARLVHFDVSLGTLGPAGVAALVRVRPCFASLATLDVSRSFLDRAALGQLVSAYRGCVVYGDAQEVATPPGQRYCAISE